MQKGLFVNLGPGTVDGHGFTSVPTNREKEITGHVNDSFCYPLTGDLGYEHPSSSVEMCSLHKRCTQRAPRWEVQTQSDWNHLM